MATLARPKYEQFERAKIAKNKDEKHQYVSVIP
jgi:hypothetical protein